MWIAPVSGPRFHIARDCNCLRQAKSVRRVTIENVYEFHRLEHLFENVILCEPEPHAQT